jgi:hypothetical protein
MSEVQSVRCHGYCFPCHGRDWDEGLLVEAVDLSLRAGSSKHDEGGAVHGVARVMPHQQYDQDIHDYDIALLKVGDCSGLPPFVHSSASFSTHFSLYFLFLLLYVSIYPALFSQ